MGLGTKEQFYRYSMRSVLGRGFTMCRNIFMFEVLPPDNAQSIENLFVHFKCTFLSDVPSGDRKVERIGIVNDFLPYDQAFDTEWHRYLDIDKSADANRVVEFSVDLTSLLNKQNAGANDGLLVGGVEDATLIYVKLPDALSEFVSGGLFLTSGTINIWKADAVYTTREIR